MKVVFSRVDLVYDRESFLERELQEKKGVFLVFFRKIKMLSKRESYNKTHKPKYF